MLNARAIPRQGQDKPGRTFVTTRDEEDMRSHLAGIRLENPRAEWQNYPKGVQLENPQAEILTQHCGEADGRLQTRRQPK